MEDLLPPEPPGMERKEGFFKKLFGSKKEKSESGIIVQQGNLQQIAQQMPSPLEKMPVAEDVDLEKLRKQLGLASVLESQAPPAPAGLRQEPSLQEKLQELKPRYTPQEEPELPEFTSDVQEYKKDDFTKDVEAPPAAQPPARDVLPDYNTIPKPAKKIKEAVKEEVFEPKKASVDWTNEVKERAPTFPKQPVNAPREIVKEPVQKAKPLRSLEPDALDSFSKKPVKGPQSKLDWASQDSKLEEDLSAKPKENIDFTQEPGPVPKRKQEELSFIPEPERIATPAPVAAPPLKQADFSQEPVIVKKDPTLEQIRKATEESLLVEEPESITPGKAFMGQPVAKFAEDMKEKLRLEVQEEERKKLMLELDEEKARLQTEREDFEKQKKDIESKLRQVEEKENNIIQKTEENSRLKNELKEERDRIKADREEHKALKEKLPKLKRQHEELTAKVNSLKDKIDLNQKIDENLTLREKALKEAQNKLEQMESSIREKGFSDFLDEELTEKNIAYPAYTEPEDKSRASNGELYQAVDECRGLIWDKRLPEAREAYMKARELYHNLLAEGVKSEEIYMLIRELYDDLNLAILKE